MTSSDGPPDPPSDPTPTSTPTAKSPSAGFEPTIGADPAPAVSRDRGAPPNYRLGEVLGRGGMGEVVLARDIQIGRDVAIKRMRMAEPSDEAISRFLREARIQARLEHPAIVPVHELGRDRDGQPFFTMKRLAGVTLRALMSAKPRPPRPRLLRIFADVCNAVEFAHSHGVIHRDLKPTNTMIGDFGEVYVLDWGLARVVGEAETGSIAADIATLDGMTQVGTVLGTPGYMAPEQVRGVADIGAPADVYALGSMLFEILAGEALHPPGAAALQTTIAALDGSPARRQPDRDIPPELDELCVAALQDDPAKRPTARELANRVESYLDGDRDLERRRLLSTEWLDKARAALADDDVGRRAEALQNAGRALAIDPDSREAAELFTRLIVEPAKQNPPELQRELELAESAVQRRQSWVATLSFIAIGIFLVLLSLSGLRSALTLVLLAALASVMAATALRLSRRPARSGEMLAVVIGNAVLAAMLSRAFGSLILAPAVTCVMAVSLTSYPHLLDRAKLVIAILVASWVSPIVLERAGVLTSTWDVVAGSVVSTSPMISIGGSTATLLIGANILTIVVIGLFANALARSRRDAQRRAEAQAWHLRQLLPPSAEAS
jgi:eukaryotic-like serine/threonine-protein kinase